MEVDCEKKTLTVNQRTTTLVRRSSSASTSREKLAALSTLEKKNKQLDNATKELEKKVKSLRQKSQLRTVPNVVKTAPPRSQSAPPRELPSAPCKTLETRRGSTVTSRIREREAEFSRQVQERDEQITRLKERLSLLSKKLTENKEACKFPRDKSKEQHQRQLLVQEQGVELQSIIRQVTKERLQLERHLQIANDSLQRNNGVDLQKYLSLEQTNCHLRHQLDSLDILQQEHKLVEIQYREKEEACRELMNTLKYKSALCEDLETQLAKVIEKNTELTIANSDLQKKVVELHGVNEECQTLKSTLEKFESECVTAKSEVQNLSGKVRNLESVLDEMHKAAENRREIERQHKEALENLKRKQEEVEFNSTKKQEEMIRQMKKKIEELEDEKREQNERHQELILEMAEFKKYGGTSVGPESLSDAERPSDNLEIDEIMAKLEQDNKFLDDLEKQREKAKRRESGSSDRSPTSSASSAMIHRAGSAITDSGFLSTTSLNGSSASPNSTGRNFSSASCGSLNKLPGLTGADKINLLNGRFSADAPDDDRQLSPVSNGLGLKVEKDGSVEVPGKGWRFVFVARYSYDPFQHSPNESPEAELQVNAGDYILVWGDADEDGFFDGELLDGRRGLVPSNFVEKLEGEELLDFHRQVVLGLGDCDDSVCTSIPQDLDFISSDEGADDRVPASVPATSYQHRKTDILPRYASCTDLDNTEDEETDAGGITEKRVPPPKQLTLETHLNKSLVIGWNPPDNFPTHKIESFRVVVDGAVRSVVGSSETRATVTGLDLSAIHRISVKTVSASDGRTSLEAACTVVVGKEAPLGPTSVTATKVASTSASISWIPSNSNFLHSICVNNVEVKTVKPGVFRHTLAGLQPDTSYKVTVRAKNIMAAPYNMTSSMTNGRFQDLSATVEVRTLPRGPPEAPVDVEVIEGPRDRTLLVSWLPVTINPSGTSNGAPVTGYAVYIDGKRVKEVDSGTADQAIVELTPSITSPKYVTVRTKSSDKLSNESSAAPIPLSLRNKLNNDSFSGLKTSSNDILNGSGGARPRDPPGPAMMVNYSGYPELDSDIGPSELSDIAEEPEEGLTDSDSDRATPHYPLPMPPQQHPARRKPSVVESAASLSRWSKAGSEDNLHITSASSSQAGGSATTTTNITAAPAPKPKLVQVIQQQLPPPPLPVKVALPPPKPVVRIFVALFDYDPPTMSPNPDACDEELPFREGQLIKVYGEKDADGFYWGEAGNRTGYVPCNMVSEVQVDDDRVAEELFREQSSPGVSAAASSRDEEEEYDDRWGDIYEDAPARRKLALYDYDPNQLSPNVDSEVELSFRAGDIVLVFGDMDDDGFFMGELHGRRGLVPSNFLTDVPPTAYVRVDPLHDVTTKNYLPINGGLHPLGMASVQRHNSNNIITTAATTTSAAASNNNQNRVQPRVLGQQRRW